MSDMAWTKFDSEWLNSKLKIKEISASLQVLKDHVFKIIFIGTISRV